VVAGTGVCVSLTVSCWGAGQIADQLHMFQIAILTRRRQTALGIRGISIAAVCRIAQDINMTAAQRCMLRILTLTVNTALAGAHHSEDWDNTSDRLTKLAYQDVRHGQALKEALREHHYAQYSFAPDINPRSRAMGKVRGPHTIFSMS